MKKLLLLLALYFASQIYTQENLALQVLDKITTGSIATAAILGSLATLYAAIATKYSIESYYEDQKLVEEARLAGKEYDPGYHYIMPRALGTVYMAAGTFLFWRAFSRLITTK